MDDEQTRKNRGKRGIDKTVNFLDISELATQTIDLQSLLTKDLSSSGSFDIWGHIWQTTFGKVLQALPIPAFLIDQFVHVVTANQAFERIPRRHSDKAEFPLAEMFPDLEDAEPVLAIVADVFASRKPRVTEAVVGYGPVKIWSRMTFRSIRIGIDRFVLAILEDLTAEKKIALQMEKEDQLLRKARDELEQQVRMRTEELVKTNEALLTLAERVQKMRAQERNLALQTMRILVYPLIQKLKAEPAPRDRVISIADAMEIALQEVSSSYHSDVAKIFPELTPREMDVVELLAFGLSSKQIASIMGVGLEAVNAHRYRVKQKLVKSDTHEPLSNWLRKRLAHSFSAEGD